MAHFAKLNEENVVTQVIVVNNDVLLDDNNNESEIIGINFCKSLLGGNWIQTSYNGKFRYNYAGIGYTYDPIDDAFIAPIPCSHDELELNENKQWVCTNSEHESNVG